MESQPNNPERQRTGPLSRRISRRDAIKIGGLATLGLAFHRPVIETIKPTQIFANNCYGCQPAALYSPSPISTNDLFEPPVSLTTSITFCVDDSIYNNLGLTVELVAPGTLTDKVMASQFVSISSTDLPGTCIQGRVLTWPLECSIEGNVKSTGGYSSSQTSPLLSVKFGGQKVGQVQAFGCG